MLGFHSTAARGALTSERRSNEDDMMDDITRRDFVKQTIVGTAAMTTGASAGLSALQAGAAAPDQRTQIVSALGALFVTSKPGDPGYAGLESHGITAFMLKNFQVD